MGKGLVLFQFILNPVMSLPKHGFTPMGNIMARQWPWDGFRSHSEIPAPLMVWSLDRSMMDRFFGCVNTYARLPYGVDVGGVSPHPPVVWVWVWMAYPNPPVVSMIPLNDP